MDIQERLFQLQDREYRDFNAALIPTVPKELVIGVRTPELRKLAKEVYKSGEAADFMAVLPHEYFEEDNLHGFLIEQIKDFNECIKALDRFLPYVDNWGTCDSMRPKVLGKHKMELLEHIKRWISSEHTYTIRFGIGMLMCHFLDEDFRPEYLDWANVESDEYYVNMMCAWYYATALAKQYGSTLPYIEPKKLPKWVHNKAIQKARESNRINKEQKEYLNSLKIRG